MSNSEFRDPSTNGSGRHRSREPSRIVVVGDSLHSVETLQTLIAEDGFRLVPSETAGREASDTDTNTPDLVLLDLDTIAAAGRFEKTLNSVRSRFEAPILCLLPLVDHLEPRLVVRLGVDDYLFKPIRPSELLLRIHVLLQKMRKDEGLPLIERRRGGRRRADHHSSRSSLPKSRCLIDDASKSVTLEGRPLHLSPKEYELFRLLATEVGRIFSVQEILAQVWRDVRRASASDVHQYMHLLRRKIETPPGQRRWIITVKGFGYKLVVPDEPGSGT